MITLGIDIGSTTSKCAVVGDGKALLGTSLVMAGIGTGGAEEAFGKALADAGLTEAGVDRILATGYGRESFTRAERTVSELSCHGRGALFFCPTARTVIDIGGQDAKAIAMGENGLIANFVMNDKCAAGTGRFLDVMAGLLQMEIGDFGDAAERAKSPVNISNTCTVFAESEVISQLASGAVIDDVVAGICQSVASRTGALAKRVGVHPDVFMSGGVARNGGVRAALEDYLGYKIHWSEQSQLCGAVGAALLACNE